MKALGVVATYLALLIGTSASYAQTETENNYVKFEFKGGEPITLEECMEALEQGTAVPGFTGGGSFLVVYDGNMFTFFMKPETLSFCNKRTPTKID